MNGEDGAIERIFSEGRLNAKHKGAARTGEGNCWYEGAAKATIGFLIQFNIINLFPINLRVLDRAGDLVGMPLIRASHAPSRLYARKISRAFPSIFRIIPATMSLNMEVQSFGQF